MKLLKLTTLMLAALVASPMCMPSLAQSTTSTTQNKKSTKNKMAQQYDDFAKKAAKDYEDFRQKANQVYAEFMRNAWAEFDLEPPMEKLKDLNVEPIPIPVWEDEEEEEQQPIAERPKHETAPKPTVTPVVTPTVTPDLTPIPIVTPGPVIAPEPDEEEEPIAEVPQPRVKIKGIPANKLIPTPKSQPVPISPVKETTWPEQKTVATTFYGTRVNVRFDPSQKFTLSKLTNDELADTWLKCSTEEYNNTISDCLGVRKRLGLNDWAYLNFLLEFSRSALGSENEAFFMAGYIYTQSGYKMRFFRQNDNELRVMFASTETIYGVPYLTRDNMKLYALSGKFGTIQMCDAPFEKEQPLNLFMPVEPKFSTDFSDERTLTSSRYPDMTAKVAVDKNRINFYNDYPQFTLGDNQLTRWAIYTDMSLDDIVKQQLYPSLQAAIEGCDERTAVNKILNFVQTAFEYGYDTEIWGCDRSFFGEETIFYPYSDCEDRAILFTRLVRDLVGIPTALIYYPGHLGAAIALSEEGSGDTVDINGRTFTIADPTYINAKVGMSMPKMTPASGTAILLK